MLDAQNKAIAAQFNAQLHAQLEAHNKVIATQNQVITAQRQPIEEISAKVSSNEKEFSVVITFIQQSILFAIQSLGAHTLQNAKLAAELQHQADRRADREAAELRHQADS